LEIYSSFFSTSVSRDVSVLANVSPNLHRLILVAPVSCDTIVQLALSLTSLQTLAIDGVFNCNNQHLKALQQCVQLQQLMLSPAIAISMDAITQLLVHCTRLETLCLDRFIALPPVTDNPTLTNLQLHGTFIQANDDVDPQIFTGLQQLYFNSPNNVHPFFESLCSAARTLTHLTVRGPVCSSLSVICVMCPLLRRISMEQCESLQDLMSLTELRAFEADHITAIQSFPSLPKLHTMSVAEMVNMQGIEQCTALEVLVVLAAKHPSALMQKLRMIHLGFTTPFAVHDQLTYLHMPLTLTDDIAQSLGQACVRLQHLHIHESTLGTVLGLPQSLTCLRVNAVPDLNTESLARVGLHLRLLYCLHIPICDVEHLEGFSTGWNSLQRLSVNTASWRMTQQLATTRPGLILGSYCCTVLEEELQRYGFETRIVAK